MRRSASTLCVLTLIFSCVGCSTVKRWFSYKKTSSDPYADYYQSEPTTLSSADDLYPVYEPLPAEQNYPASAVTTVSTDGGARYHTVVKKDTLYSIAREYYNGDQSKWRAIYEANRTDINDPNKIRVGQRLIIP